MLNFKLPTAIVLFIPILISCGKTTSINTHLELTGKWQLESVVQASDTIHKPSKKQGLYDVSVTFKDQGELEATSANNYLTGFYETAQQNNIQMDGDGTERNDTQWGNLFVNALPNVNLYELKPNRLILFYDNDNQLIFSRSSVPDQDLTASR
jgi:hypothetical protein